MITMNTPLRSAKLALLLVACFFAHGVLAEKPSWAGDEKHGKKNSHQNEKKSAGRQGDDERERGDADRSGFVDVRIASRDRQIVLEYYQAQSRSGHCPPGLAKKNNGCQPPGQAKKWSRGRALPSGIEIHDLPYDLRVRLPLPPAGHRYVQVAADVLLIAVGTNMVIDAIEDLTR